MGVINLVMTFRAVIHRLQNSQKSVAGDGWRPRIFSVNNFEIVRLYVTPNKPMMVRARYEKTVPYFASNALFCAVTHHVFPEINKHKMDLCNK